MAGFSIEVAGETNPLTEAALQKTLRDASSHGTQAIQSGAKQLENWSDQKGFYSLLQNTFMDKILPFEVRMLSIIQIKNGVDKHWRRAAINSVSAAEREHIRGRLLQSTLDEPHDRLADLSAIVTAKIARFEYPAQWKNLMKDLIAILQESTSPDVPVLRLLRALTITHHIVKELSTLRITMQKAAFQSAAPEVLKTLQDIYSWHVNQWQSAVAGPLNQQTMQAMNVSEKALKVIRRLTVNGFDFPHRVDIIRTFWGETCSHVEVYLQMHKRDQLQNAYRISAVAHAKQLGLLHLNMASTHGVAFALLPGSKNLVRTYWNTAKQFRKIQLATEEIDDDENQVYSSFSLRAILILRACLKTAFEKGEPFRYRNEAGKDDPANAKRILNENLFTPAVIKDLFEAVIGQFFFYVRSDVEEWVSEPEEWDMKEEGDEDAHDKSLRSAAERLFMDLTLHYKALVISPLLAEVGGAAASSANMSPIMKDAVYSALSVAAPILKGNFDFNTFLTTTLVSDMQDRDPSYAIARRRITTLLARWTPIDISEGNRILVYQMYVTMLDPNDTVNNLSVRIMAGKRLGDIVDEFSFTPLHFRQFVPEVTSRLLGLIREVNLPETKLALLNTVSRIVLRMSSEVVPFATDIVAILQTLWDESGTEHMMQAAIVTVLKRLLRSMGRAAVQLQPTMLATITATVRPGSELQVYLSEAALDLWIAVLELTPAPASEELLSMMQYIFPFLSDEDHTARALKILRSYVLLAPERILNDNVRGLLFQHFTNLLDVKTSAIVDSASITVELLIRAADGIGGDQATQVVVESLVSSGFAPRMFNSLNQSWQHHDTTGPTKRPQPRDWKNTTNYLLILARVIMSSTSSFFYMAQQYAESAMLTIDVVLRRFLDECYQQVDAINMPTDTKLICLALTKLLDNGDDWVLAKLQDLMSFWTTVVIELQDGEERGTDCLIYRPPAMPVVTDEPESDRNSAAMYADPVHSVNITQYVRYHLQLAIQQAGGEDKFREEWLVNVDKEVIKGFGALGIM